MVEEKKPVEETAGQAVVSEKPEQEREIRYDVESADVDYVKMLQQHKERSLYVESVRKDVLSRTKPYHWIARRDSNGNIVLNLTAPGAEHIKSNCVLGYQNKTDREDAWTKEIGPGFTIYYEGDFWLGHPSAGTIHAIGTCSSDDEFFSVDHKQLPYNPDNAEQMAALDKGEGRVSPDEKVIYIRRRIPSAEVSKENIRKSAYSNFFVNGVTRVLGIRAIAPEELAELGMDITRIPSMDYLTGKREKLSAALERDKKKIWKMLVSLSGGDQEKAADDLQKRTAFVTKDGREYAGCIDWKRLTENQINTHFPPINEEYTAWKKQASPMSGKKTKKKAKPNASAK